MWSRMSSRNVMIICLIVEYIKKVSLYEMSCCPQPDVYARNKIKAVLDLSSFAKKSDVKAQQVLRHQL